MTLTWTLKAVPYSAYIISILFWFFPEFLRRNTQISFFGHLPWTPYLEMCTDHINTTPTLSTTVDLMFLLFFPFFPDFLAIFALITIFGNVHRPCKHYSKIVNKDALNFFLFFLDFLTIFALLTIFGNVHWPCKRYPYIVNNSLRHVYSFCLHLSWFSGYICIDYHIWKCAQTM